MVASRVLPRLFREPNVPEGLVSQTKPAGIRAAGVAVMSESTNGTVLPNLGDR